MDLDVISSTHIYLWYIHLKVILCSNIYPSTSPSSQNIPPFFPSCPYSLVDCLTYYITIFIPILLLSHLISLHLCIVIISPLSRIHNPSSPIAEIAPNLHITPKASLLSPELAAVSLAGTALPLPLPPRLPTTLLVLESKLVLALPLPSVEVFAPVVLTTVVDSEEERERVLEREGAVNIGFVAATAGQAPVLATLIVASGI